MVQIRAPRWGRARGAVHPIVSFVRALANLRVARETASKEDTSLQEEQEASLRVVRGAASKEDTSSQEEQEAEATLTSSRVSVANEAGGNGLSTPTNQRKSSKKPAQGRGQLYKERYRKQQVQLQKKEEAARVDGWFAAFSMDDPSLGLSRESLRALLTHLHPQRPPEDHALDDLIVTATEIKTSQIYFTGGKNGRVAHSKTLEVVRVYAESLKAPVVREEASEVEAAAPSVDAVPATLTEEVKTEEAEVQVVAVRPADDDPNPCCC